MTTPFSSVLWWPGDGSFWTFFLDDLGKAEVLRPCLGSEPLKKMGRVSPQRVALMVGFLTHFKDLLQDYSEEASDEVPESAAMSMPMAKVRFLDNLWHFPTQETKEVSSKSKFLDWSAFRKFAQATTQTFFQVA